MPFPTTWDSFPSPHGEPTRDGPCRRTKSAGVGPTAHMHAQAASLRRNMIQRSKTALAWCVLIPNCCGDHAVAYVGDMANVNQRGGLLCRRSNVLQMKRWDKMCRDSRGEISVVNQGGSHAHVCQTVMPGNVSNLCYSSATESSCSQAEHRTN